MRLLTPLLLVCLAPVLSAQEPEASGSGFIEEITIVGEKSLLVMRQQIEREEETLYRLFNDLNNNDDLDIKCRLQRKRLSHISERVCEPVFLSRQRTEANQSSLMEMRKAWSDEGIDPVLFMNALETMKSEVEVAQQVEHKYEELNAEMLRIALENPDYLAQLQKISGLKAELESTRKSRFDRP